MQGDNLMLAKLTRSLLVISIVFSITSAAIAVDYQYVGSRKSNKYHYFSCRWAKKIKQKNEILFKNVKHALKKGYIACKVCHPPLRD